MEINVIKEDNMSELRDVKYRDIGLFTNKINITAGPLGEGGASTEYRIRLERITDESGPIREYDYLDIKFQSGDPREEVNGFTNEALLSVLIDRMEGFQSGPFKSREGALVLTKLEEALHWMFARTLDRRFRGVEGKKEQ